MHIINRSEWGDPVELHLDNGNYSLYSARLPGSGNVLAAILNILDNFKFSPDSLSHQNKKKTYQLIVEAFKYAYGFRTHLGDEKFVEDIQEVFIWR